MALVRLPMFDTNRHADSDRLPKLTA